MTQPPSNPPPNVPPPHNVPPPNVPPPRTVFGALTQLVRQARTHLDLSKVELRPHARVPKIEIEEGTGLPPRTFPLVGDRYILGRSSQTSDIVIANPIVSQTHASFNRSRRKGSGFTVRDEGSTNGIYWRKKRYNSLELRHGDHITLGPPELADAVPIRFLNPPRWYVRGGRWLGYGVGAIALLSTLAVGIEWQKFSVKLLGSVRGPIVAYAGDGTPLQTLRSTSHRELPSLKDYSTYLPKAVVASEDSRFYWHFGFDPVRVLGAIVINLQSGGVREGASTLTQQIARSLYPQYVGSEDSVGRKLREIIVAMKLETFYSKDFLLLTYLNRVYLGVGYGFEDAAQEYFNKSARDLTLSEAATLVGMLPAPNSFNPCEDLETSTGLRNRVINRMLELGMVSREEAQAGRRSPIVIDPAVCRQSNTVISPYYYSQITQELTQLLGSETAEEGNFIIETSLDLKLQKAAETALKDAIRYDGETYNFDQGAIVTLDANSGSLLALVGGLDYQKSQFNRATQALRQPGSTFKVFAYAAALTQGASPNATYSCAPLTWEGQGYSGCERSGGNISMYTGMAQSENAIALRIAQTAGLDAVVSTARAMGISAKLNPVPGLVLGQSEVTPLEMAGAYGVLANNGILHRPHAINRVYDANQCINPSDRRSCRLVYDAAQAPGQGSQAIPAEVARTMTDLLRGVVQGGTGRAASIGQDAAGKTGTTNDAVDLWFVGYLPERKWVTSVWLGNDDNTPTRGSSGLAAQLWASYMGNVIR